ALSISSQRLFTNYAYVRNEPPGQHPMTSTQNRRRRGTALMEFTLVAIPLIFLVISIFEIARGMWIYHTIAYAVQQGARFSIVHGEVCTKTSPACIVSVGAVARVIRANAVGLDPAQFGIVLRSQNSTETCLPLNSCLENGGNWPPAGDGHP